jgi:hypothetical protein
MEPDRCARLHWIGRQGVAACSRGETRGDKEAVQRRAGVEPADDTFSQYNSGRGHLGIHEFSVKQLY